MAKLTFETERCKDCGLCTTACPKGLLVISDTKINKKGHPVAEITDQESCIGCAMCAAMCPDCIIKVER